MREQTGKSILLIGLADALASDLRKALPEQGWVVHSQPEIPGGAEQPAADLVFCGVEPEQCRKLLALVKSVLPGLPVVVVSRHSEISDWLDAIEAGAADYCAPPFDSRHIQWIIQSALKSRTPAA
jgi:DNA-binding NtrC family response regulator